MVESDEPLTTVYDIKTPPLHISELNRSLKEDKKLEKADIWGG